MDELCLGEVEEVQYVAMQASNGLGARRDRECCRLALLTRSPGSACASVVGRRRTAYPKGPG